MEDTGALAAAFAIGRILEDLGIAYAIGGSLASSFHGVPRSTLDCDLVVDLGAEDVPRMVERLAADFYVDRERAERAVVRGASFNVIHLPTMFKVDLFVAGGDPVSEQELARAESRELSPGLGALPVTSAEDTVVQKLSWYRLGNEVSDRQWQDLLAVLRVQRGRLDHGYLRDTARALDVEDLLDEALTQAGIS